MTGHNARWALAAGLVPALLLALVIPASTSAFQSTTSGAENDTPQRADDPSISATIWDQPASSEAVVEVRPPDPPPAASAQAPSDNPLWGIPLATLSGTRERPIFSASRRPPPPAATASAPVVAATPASKGRPVERPQLSLTGTILGEDDSYGIFLDQASKMPLRLKIGDDHEGWRLRSVEASQVTLSRGGQTVILVLPQPGASSVGPAHVPGETVDAQATQTPEPPPSRSSRQR